MSVRERVVRGKVTSEHVVQFFDSDESRIDAVTRFLGEGHRAGGALIVVARAVNWTGILEELQRHKVPVQQALADGRILYLDAIETLNRLSRHGTPDATLFDEVIAKPVSRMQRGGRLYAYGEMVDILAQRGDLSDAILLEAFWNRLAGRVTLSLMCGYSAAHFVSTTTHRALRDICSAHTHVHAAPVDPLAGWLLNSAHNTSDLSSLH
jgi:DcmR-like sensory protein